jgi:sporulation protein YlmC with PRC-barrel domain
MESRQAHEGGRWWWPEYERRQSFRGRQRGEYDPDYEGYGHGQYRGEETASDREAYGPHTGKGPRGYRRSDDRIYENVCEWLMIDGRIDADDIDVEVHNGEVSLNGTIADRQTKRRAEELAESVPGVMDVQNRLRVRGGAREAESTYGGGSRYPEEARYAHESRFMRGSSVRDAIRQGMEVIDRTGDRVGRVKEVRENDFTVDRRLEPDIGVDYQAVVDVSDRVYIDADVPDRLTRMGDFPTH